ncbi:MAG: carboxypeptidase-like regulatory domain-containing protein [Acidobacteria bacterium]|nr:carboxypeptidase-like regulatory domain-containing protein [Acidobacteriota bacterium]
MPRRGWLNMGCIIYVCLLAGLVVLAGSNSAYAQGGASGTFVGVVKDLTGAVIPGATVSIRNRDTNFTLNDKTREVGEYTFSYVPVGYYEIRVTKESFRTAVVPNVKLDTGATFRVDLTLEVGEVGQSVEVTAAAPIMQTEEPSVGYLVEEKRVLELPLNGRKFEQLQILSPGSVNAFNHQTGAGLAGGAPGWETSSSPTAIATSGSRPNQMLILVDGGSVVNNWARTAAVSPNPDEISEFKISGSNFSAEYGYGGNVINVTTKSGTNQVRLTLWEFLRNNSLDARNFFAARPEPRKRNQFGVASGGPVRLGSLYDGKDKSFWFFNFEGQRERVGRTLISSVPTAAMRRGDLSELPVTIFDPMTTRRDPTSPTGFRRDPFPNKVIPPGRLDQPVGQRFLEWVPLPNRPGFANNYLFTPVVTNDYEHYGFRFDQKTGGSGLLTFRGSYQPNNFFQGIGPYGKHVRPPYDLGTSPKEGNGSSYVLAWTNNIRPTTLMDTRIAFTRGWVETGNGAVIEGGTDWTTEAGIQGFGKDVSDVYPSLPQLSFSGFTGVPSNGGFGLAGAGNNWEYAANFTLIRGAHTIKTGYAHRRWQENSTTWGRGSGEFVYSGEFTVNPASRGGTGSGLADYLLSLPFSAGRYIPLGWYYLQIRNHWSYIQDDWKVTPKLTLNLGLRYELNFPTQEKNDAVGSFVPEGRGGRGAILVANEEALQKGVILHPPTRFSLETYRPLIQTARELGIRERSMRPLAKKSFAPRFGLAYRFTNKTVVRGGYGIFHVQLDGNRETEFISAPFLVRESGLLNQLDVDGRPLRTTQTILAGAPFSPRPNLQAHTTSDGSFGYAQQWNLFVQRELPGGFVFDVGYVGNRANKLQQTRPLNTPLPGPGPVDARRPFPDFNLIGLADQSGYSTYHAFQGKLERRFSAGLSTSVAYTRSKLIDLNTGNSGTGFDPYDFRMDRGPGDYDAPNVLATSVVYEIPFLRNVSWPLARHVLGGWTTTTILTASDGYPFTPAWSGDTGNRGAGSRPDRVCSGKLSNPTRERWFDTSCFVAPRSAGPFSIGNAGRNILRGPRLFNWDFGLYKDFHLAENRRLQFRSEFFNFTNTTNFGLPAATINAGAPGVITRAGPARIIQFGLKLYL